MIYISHIVRKWQQSIANVPQDSSNTEKRWDEGGKNLLKRFSVFYNSERTATREKFSTLLAELNYDESKPFSKESSAGRDLENREIIPRKEKEKIVYEEEPEEEIVAKISDDSLPSEAYPSDVEDDAPFRAPLQEDELSPVDPGEWDDDFTKGIFDQSSVPTTTHQEKKKPTEVPKVKTEPEAIKSYDRPKVQRPERTSRNEQDKPERSYRQTNRENKPVHKHVASPKNNEVVENTNVEDDLETFESLDNVIRSMGSEKKPRYNNDQRDRGRRNIKRDKNVKKGGNRHRWI